MRAFLALVATAGLAACATVVVPVFPPLGPNTPDPETAAQPVCAQPIDHAEQEAALYARLDNLRTAQGLPALKPDARLARAAQRQACDNATRESIDHRGSDGSDLTTRLRREGFGLWRAAENTALIRPADEDALELWMGSRAHRANLLLSTVNSVGLGRATAASGREAWVIVLGRGR